MITFRQLMVVGQLGEIGVLAQLLVGMVHSHVLVHARAHHRQMVVGIAKGEALGIKIAMMVDAQVLFTR